MRVSNEPQSRGPRSLTGPIPVTVDPLHPIPIAPIYNCHKDRAPTVNKAIIVSRHVGRRYPTTNQRNTKMIVIMMIMIIVIIIIIINIIMSMGLPNTPSRSKHPTHTTPQGGKGGNHQSPHPNHTTPQGRRGKQPTSTPHHRGGRNIYCMNSLSYAKSHPPRSPLGP